MASVDREQADVTRWPAAVAGFLPPIALTLLPLLHSQPALGAGPILALPLFLLAAVQAAGYRYESGYFAALFARGWPALLLCLVGSALTMALLGWPAWQLQQTGALGAVLMLSAAAAGLLFALWWTWPASGLVFLWDEAVAQGGTAAVGRSLAMARRVLADHGGGARGLFAALALALTLVMALAIAWPAVWPQPIWRTIAILAQALLLAPIASWLLIEATARQLLVEDERLAAPMAPRTVVPEASSPAPPLEGATASERLYAAARAGRVDDALALLAAGADPLALPGPGARDQRALPVLAALLSDLRLLRALIGAGVDINQRHAGLAPLLAATRDSWHGRPEAVMTLLANGADPRLVDAEGRSALHGAALSTDAAVAALLLDANAPLDVIDRDGWSPLGVACLNGNWRLAKFLLDRRARPEPEGGQPVLLAAAGGEDDAVGVKLLLKHKARVDARGRLNRSALHVACLAGNAEIAQALLEAGADVNARDEHAVAPLLEAARAGSAATLRVLAARRPDAGVSDNTGRNALAIACQSSRGDGGLIEQLLALGVDPQQVCGDGRRPIDDAVAAGRWSLVARLDPRYPLPACVSDSAEELADVPPLSRLRVALEARRHDHVRELVPMLAHASEEIAALLVELAPKLDPIALRLLLPACDGVAPDAAGDSLMFRLLARGVFAEAAICALLERGGQPSGQGGLARYTAAGTNETGDANAAETLALDLIARGADAFGAHSDGTPPLLLAIRRDWPRVVAALLATGVDPEARDARGAMPLLTACALGQEDAVRQLVAHGAQPGTRAADGQTALGLALSSGRREIARWLDWSGWPLPRRALRSADLPAAAKEGDIGAVSRLLDLGLPIDALDAQGCSALLRASGGGHIALVEELLVRGADPALSARSGATCLSAALSMRQDAIVQTLLAHGVAPEQALPGGITPLMVAAALGQTKGVQALLAHGANAQAADDEGGTALHAAAQFGFAARDKARVLALWDALLASGGNPDAPNVSDQTPLLLLLGARAEAGTACDEEVVLAQVERLLIRGVDLGAKERRGFGPLHLAALHGLARVLRALLAAGADPDVRDSINRRPQEIALMRGFVDIAAEFGPAQASPSIARFLRP